MPRVKKSMVKFTFFLTFEVAKFSFFWLVNWQHSADIQLIKIQLLNLWPNLCLSIVFASPAANRQAWASESLNKFSVSLPLCYLDLISRMAHPFFVLDLQLLQNDQREKERENNIKLDLQLSQNEQREKERQNNIKLDLQLSQNEQTERTTSNGWLILIVQLIWSWWKIHNKEHCNFSRHPKNAKDDRIVDKAHLFSKT